MPFLFELRRPYRLYRDTTAALDAARVANLRVAESAEDTDATDLPQQRDAIRARTCHRAQLFGVLLTVVLLWWTKLLLVNREGLISLASAECLMLALMFGAQMLAQAFLNWKIRGGDGGMPAFLAGSAGRWPR